MPRHRIFPAVIAFALLALGGCVAYPVDGVYADTVPAYVAPPSVYITPPPIYFGGGYRGYRPHYGGRGHGGWGHGGWGHRGSGHRGWR